MQPLPNSTGANWQDCAISTDDTIHYVFEKAVPGVNKWGVFYMKAKDDFWSPVKYLSVGCFYAETPTVTVKGKHVVVVWRERTKDKKSTYLKQIESTDGGDNWI